MPVLSTRIVSDATLGPDLSALPERGVPRWVQSLTLVVVAALPTVAAIPLASNRPAAWLFWTALLLCLAGIYILVVSWRQPDLRLQAADQSGLFLLWGLLIAWSLIQSVALARAMPEMLQTLPAAVVQLLPRPESLSLAPEASRLAALRLAGYGALAFLILQVNRKARHRNLLAWSVFLGVTAHAVWALLSLKVLGDQGAWGDKLAYFGAATGTFVNRNSFASFLGIGMVAGLVALAEQMQPSTIRSSQPASLLSFERLVLLAPACGLLLIAIALISTQSRMGLLSTAVALLYLLPAIVLSRAGSRRRAIGLAVSGLLGLVALLALLGGSVLDRAIFLAEGASTRMTLYREVAEMIRDRPWTGFGGDAFEPAFLLYQHPPLFSQVRWEDAHSTYLENWADYGLVFGSLPVVVLLGALWRLARVARSRRSASLQAHGGIAALILAGVHSTVDFSFEIPANVYLLILLVGLGLVRPKPSGAAAHV